MPSKNKQHIPRIGFLSFLNTLDIEDSDIKAFLQFSERMKRMNKRIHGSSPVGHAAFLGYWMESEAQLTGYKKCMLEYFDEPRNMLPKEIANDIDALLKTFQSADEWFDRFRKIKKGLPRLH